MKKNILKFGVIFLLAISLNVGLVLAAASNEDTLNQLLPQAINPGVSDEMSAYSKLPQLSGETIIASVIKIVLQAAMLITVIGIIIAGIYYITDRGNEEQTKKAKNVVLYLVIGMAIMAGSYAIIAGISKFKFLE